MRVHVVVAVCAANRSSDVRTPAVKPASPPDTARRDSSPVTATRRCTVPFRTPERARAAPAPVRVHHRCRRAAVDRAARFTVERGGDSAHLVLARQHRVHWAEPGPALARTRPRDAAACRRTESAIVHRLAAGDRGTMRTHLSARERSPPQPSACRRRAHRNRVCSRTNARRPPHQDAYAGACRISSNRARRSVPGDGDPPLSCCSTWQTTPTPHLEIDSASPRDLVAAFSCNPACLPVNPVRLTRGATTRTRRPASGEHRNMLFGSLAPAPYRAIRPSACWCRDAWCLPGSLSWLLLPVARLKTAAS